MVDTIIFVAVTAVYLLIVLFLGYLGYKRTKDTQDFMLAGRKVPPLLIALSYGATFISTSAIVGFGGVAAQLGMGLIWLTVLNIALGIFIAFVIFGKKTREIGQKLGAVTFPDLIAKRFNSKFMQQACGLIILFGMPLYTSAVMIGGAQFLSSTLNLDYNTALLAFAAVTALYVVGGGLLAVIYTDAFQGAIMFVGMAILLIFTYSMLGGFDAANQALTNLADKVPASLAAAGQNGWTAMPDLGSSIWYKMITTIVLGVGIGVLAQPQLVVRFMTAKDGKTLNRAVVVGGIFILMMTGVAFTVGALSNVYFFDNFGKVAVAYQPNVDKIMPDFINLALPGWFVVLFMVTLLAAAMSTLSSLFHTMGTAFGHDLLKYTKNYKPSINNNRIGILIMFAISLVLALHHAGEHHREGDGHVHGPVCLGVPADVHLRAVQQEAVQESGHRRPAGRRGGLAPVDRLRPRGGVGPPRDMQVPVRPDGAAGLPVQRDRSAGGRHATLHTVDRRGLAADTPHPGSRRADRQSYRIKL